MGREVGDGNRRGGEVSDINKKATDDWSGSTLLIFFLTSHFKLNFKKITWEGG